MNRIPSLALYLLAGTLTAFASPKLLVNASATTGNFGDPFRCHDGQNVVPIAVASCTPATYIFQNLNLTVSGSAYSEAHYGILKDHTTADASGNSGNLWVGFGGVGIDATSMFQDTQTIT